MTNRKYVPTDEKIFRRFAGFAAAWVAFVIIVGLGIASVIIWAIINLVGAVAK